MFYCQDSGFIISPRVRGGARHLPISMPPVIPSSPFPKLFPKAGACAPLATLLPAAAYFQKKHGRMLPGPSPHLGVFFADHSFPRRGGWQWGGGGYLWPSSENISSNQFYLHTVGGKSGNTPKAPPPPSVCGGPLWTLEFILLEGVNDGEDQTRGLPGAQGRPPPAQPRLLAASP